MNSNGILHLTVEYRRKRQQRNQLDQELLGGQIKRKEREILFSSCQMRHYAKCYNAYSSYKHHRKKLLFY